MSGVLAAGGKTGTKESPGLWPGGVNIHSITAPDNNCPTDTCDAVYMPGQQPPVGGSLNSGVVDGQRFGFCVLGQGAMLGEVGFGASAALGQVPASLGQIPVLLVFGQVPAAFFASQQALSQSAQHSPAAFSAGQQDLAAALTGQVVGWGALESPLPLVLAASVSLQPVSNTVTANRAITRVLSITNFFEVLMLI